MKVRWLKIILFFIIVFGSGTWFFSRETLLTENQAAQISRNTPEVRSFFALNNGEFSQCIEKDVRLPCETDWVSCVDEAWVVQHKFGTRCGIDHDGRLSVTHLIDAKEGRIISKFPEVDYMKSSTYCLDDFDCIMSKNHGCLNFIYGQIVENVGSAGCGCRLNQCQSL